MFALRPRPPPVRKDKSSARSVSGTRYPHGIDDTIPITKKETHLTSDGEIIGDLHLHNASFSTYNDRDFSYTPSNVYFRSPSPSDFSCPLRKAMLLSGVLEEIPSMSDELLNAPHSNLSFTRRPVPDISREPPESALTNLLNSPSPPVINPFSCLTGPLPSGEDLINIRVYFPHAESPKGKFLEFKVEKEAEVDRLIVLALWTYWEMAWFPPLPVNHIDDSNSPRVSTLSKFLNAKLHRATSLWTLRIVKDDFLDYATEGPWILAVLNCRISCPSLTAILFLQLLMPRIKSKYWTLKNMLSCHANPRVHLEMWGVPFLLLNQPNRGRRKDLEHLVAIPIRGHHQSRKDCLTFESLAFRLEEVL
ncbi:Component of a membrane-bound complex containing the Tor2p kinase, variant 2 [Stygiomarasmius scandens]|uniref:Component of a membrane-bound complex containing the Tor2p kinase, variant 2 n=1 Tax=Marasmiellus scandens TaxID=2682957 RepID=A0ABR1JQ13_9AGAR